MIAATPVRPFANARTVPDVRDHSPLSGDASVPPSQIEPSAADVGRDADARTVRGSPGCSRSIRAASTGVGLPPPGVDWALEVDRAKAAQYGVSPASVGTVVQLVTNGLKLTEYRPAGTDKAVDIRLRLPEDRRTLSTLDELRVQTSQGSVPISNFVIRTPQPKVGVLNRIDVTSRTLVTLVEPGSCFAGTLAELVFAADRSYMLVGQKQGDNRPPPAIALSAMNFGPYPMSHGLTRLQSRFQADPSQIDDARAKIGEALDAEAAEELGLVTFALDDIDWDDEVRVFFEERTSFSPDGLTGMEANLRFVGPETMESKIFSRLTAWQNWIFQRPNAVGEEGALRRYGTGVKAQFDMTRV